ncbi:hypothetical protein CASFOL_010737 [Castilleja foliolosa]|uniref:Uncharacterized protein n=1 Tax=Castilleja foliolosa TaxID=1961234 RepID=A0ABD3DVK0_9LAMI
MSSGSLSAVGEDVHHESAVDLNIISSVQDRKDQALLVLRAELMDRLNKEVKSLDDDSWMFDGPRSCIHLISGQVWYSAQVLGNLSTSGYGPTKMIYTIEMLNI